MKNIGLMGLTFVSTNKGCMALAYSFKEIIERHITDDFEMVYVFSFDDYNVNEIESLLNMKIIYISLKNPKTLLEAIKIMKKCNFIFDFTEGDSFSDIYGLKRFVKIAFVKELAIVYSQRYILCPQTYGPYSSWFSKKIAKHILKNSYYICSRDLISSDMVKQLIEQPVDVYTDVALGLKKEKIEFCKENNRKNVGINVSALLWNGGYNKRNQFGLKVDYRIYIQKLIEKLININEYNIHLIPHVYDSSKDGIENDYAVIRKLGKRYSDCIIAPCYYSPAEIKGYISEMDYFIGSRMHATIAAFSTGVKTIPFSYSHKFEGLYNSLNYKFVINAKEESTVGAIERTLFFIEHDKELVNAQIEAINIVSEKLSGFENKIANLLNGE